jgi:hypothetical protein
MGRGGNPEVQRIMAAYEEMVPGVRSSWPGMGTGLAAVVDHVRRVTVPVVFGTVEVEIGRGLGFASDREWWSWCREDRDLAARTCFAFADLYDLTYGLDELRGGDHRGLELWKMATSNLSDVASILPGTSRLDSVLQPICLTAELSLKAALVQNGADPESFRKGAKRKDAEGHNLARLAERLARETPHRDDGLVREVVSRLPSYVHSRYAPVGLTRIDVVRVAIGAQFVAASSVRRYSDRDLAAQMEREGWPAPRRNFFS